MKEAIIFKDTKRHLLCRFSCDLDDVVDQLFEDTLLDKIQQSGKLIVFDLASVEYVSYSFLKTSILAAREAKGMHITIINARPDIKDVFLNAKTGKIFRFKRLS